MYQCDLSLISKPNENNISNKQFFGNQEQLETWISHNYDLTKQNYYVLCNGKKIDSFCDESRIRDSIFHVIPRTLGGKGGFGSMLRAIGAQIEKTTNREACRDLSGRRLRDINEEQRLKNWISQQAEREREAAERKKQKLERLCQEPKYEFKDDTYDESRSAMAEKMSSSVEQGFKASTSKTNDSTDFTSKNTTSTSNTERNKRKHSVNESGNKLPTKKKRNLWIDIEESDSSESAEGDCETVLASV
uniref:SDE2-like domain-containing protein n=1 Tax=Graphocephala atropunctata TaxID=36148 RepID=A0A1B6MKP3_9HEMI